MNSITHIQTSLNTFEIMNIYSQCDYVIPMRYHACLFSIYTETPFLPLYTTRKINNLLKDISWNISYKLPMNEKDIPIDLSYTELLDKFNILQKSVSNKELIKKINDTFRDDLNNISNIFSNDYNIFTEQYIQHNDTVSKTIQDEQSIDLNTIEVDSKYAIVDILINKIDDFKNKLTYMNEDDLKNTIVQMISYYITNGNFNSIYNYGLYTKLFDKKYNIRDELTWIVNDYKPVLNVIPNNPKGMFNMTFIDQIDYSGVHRAGWSYVYDHLIQYNNINSTLYLDLYIDKTFHWNYKINKILNLVPYTNNWMGFVHHTFDTTFSENNNVNLFLNKDFIISLNCCKGIFVLSKYLQQQFIKQLHNINVYNVPVYSFVHPTDMNVKTFDYVNFLKNNDKYIINIGGWLRNIYNFYKLEIPPPKEYYCINFYKGTNFAIKKAVLKGKNMNNYFPDEHLLEQLQKIIVDKDPDNIPTNIISNISVPTAMCSTHGLCSYDGNFINNNWNRHFYNDIKNMIDTMTILNYVNDIDYDLLFINNIVFLNLVDASAVNTLIECIVRTTPIIINKLEPIVELLGYNYPLYYTSLNDIPYLLTKQNIYKAYKYLYKLNKQKYTIDYFISNFLNIVASISTGIKT